MSESGFAQQFIERLRALEQSHDVDGIVSLFADDSDVGNVVSPREFIGQDGAREFWTGYRGTFGDVASEFRAVIESGDKVALEWTSVATAATTGAPIRYDGVSMLDLRGDTIVRFRAYFDSADLGRQIHGQHHGDGA